ncbi:g10868 [Coccomyxa viridis]|uniref:G10868 protein n=1 Tax=Coccomyxa viridis TaxID=1274662 RepID=A0ABP1G937_9CHLO
MMSQACITPQRGTLACAGLGLSGHFKHSFTGPVSRISLNNRLFTSPASGTKQAPGAKASVRRFSSTSGGGSIGGGSIGGGGRGGGGGGGGGGGESAGGSSGSLWSAYLGLLQSQPVLTKAWTAALLNALGDILAQKVVDKNEHLDMKRLGIFTLLGFVIIGPPLHYWYLMLSRVSVQGLPGTLVRLAMDQLLWAPFFLSTIVAAQFTLEGKRHEVVPKLKQDMRAILTTNWKIWIPFQFLNFNFVPQQLQVLASNVMALAWNIYMSSMSHKSVAAAPV